MKSKIYRATGTDSGRIVRFGRDSLEEFPEVPLEQLAQFEVEPEPEEESAPDPEAIRQAVLAEAREEAEQKLQEAYKEGLRLGEIAGREAFDARIAQVAEALEEAATAMKTARQEFLDALEPQVVELSVAVAARILQRECRGDAELIHSTVKRALARLADRQRLRLRVHPADLAAIHDQKLTLIDEFPGVEEIDIHADEEITPGGCVVDSETMHVDARIETLLADVIDTLLDRQDESR